jgi:hypothetical protein
VPDVAGGKAAANGNPAVVSVNVGAQILEPSASGAENMAAADYKGVWIHAGSPSCGSGTVMNQSEDRWQPDMCTMRGQPSSSTSLSSRDIRVLVCFGRVRRSRFHVALQKERYDSGKARAYSTPRFLEASSSDFCFPGRN